MLCGQPDRVFRRERLEPIRPDAVKTPACAFDPLIVHQARQGASKVPGLLPAAEGGHQRRSGHWALLKLEQDLRDQLGRGLQHGVLLQSENPRSAPMPNVFAFLASELSIAGDPLPLITDPASAPLRAAAEARVRARSIAARRNIQ
jgi:hypothetical protein